MGCPVIFENMKCRTTLILLFLLLLVSEVWSQDIDSLFNKPENQREDALLSIQISKQVRDNDIKLAEFHNLNAVEKLENLEDDSLLAVALIELAITYSYKSEFDKAFQANHRGLELAISFGDTLSMIDATNSMGIDYYYMGDFEKAKSYFQDVAMLCEKISNKKRLANTYNNLGLIASEEGDFEKEENYYLQAQEIFLETNDREGLAMTKLNLGSLYLLSDRYSLAEINLRESHNEYVSIGNFTGQLDVMSSLVTLNEKQGNLDRAISLAEESYETAIKKSYLSGAVHFLELLEELYLRKNDYRKAYQLVNERKVIEDSLFTQESDKTIAELETQYETAQKEKEIANLALQNQQANFELENRDNQRKIYLATIFSLIVLALFIAWRYRYKQKLSKVLEEKNQVISESLAQRETLLKEIHHRVKNNLQVISSLLNMQSRFIQDPAAVDAVKEGRNRVKSMAMIHQKLYQEENLTGLLISEYIENLVNSLERSYGITEDKVSIEFDVDEITLDIDTMIPLGLILNELVTNTFKYAFPEGKSGHLKIELKQEQHKLKLSVADNGVGFKPDSVGKKGSFGLTLIESLSEKLGAKVDIISDKGTTYNFEITRFKTV